MPAICYENFTQKNCNQRNLNPKCISPTSSIQFVLSLITIRFFCEVFVSSFEGITSQSSVAFKKQLLPSYGTNGTDMYLNSNAHNVIKN